MRYFVFLAIFVSSMVQASEDFSITYLPYYSTIQVDDPDGSTGTSSSFQPFNLVATFGAQRDTRYWFELGVAKYAFNASDIDIGQDVKQTYLNSSYQWRFRLSPNFKPWLGAGLTVSQLEQSQRHLLDEGGYLRVRLEDRSATGTSLSMHALSEYEIRNYLLTYGFFLDHSLSDSVSGFRLSLGMSF